jgi:hypothetical protein
MWRLTLFCWVFYCFSRLLVSKVFFLFHPVECGENLGKKIMNPNAHGLFNQIGEYYFIFFLWNLLFGLWIKFTPVSPEKGRKVSARNDN